MAFAINRTITNEGWMSGQLTGDNISMRNLDVIVLQDDDAPKFRVVSSHPLDDKAKGTWWGFIHDRATAPTTIEYSSDPREYKENLAIWQQIYDTNKAAYDSLIKSRRVGQ